VHRSPTRPCSPSKVWFGNSIIAATSCSSIRHAPRKNHAVSGLRTVGSTSCTAGRASFPTSSPWISRPAGRFWMSCHRSPPPFDRIHFLVLLLVLILVLILVLVPFSSLRVLSPLLPRRH